MAWGAPPSDRSLADRERMIARELDRGRQNDRTRREPGANAARADKGQIQRGRSKGLGQIGADSVNLPLGTCEKCGHSVKHTLLVGPRFLWHAASWRPPSPAQAQARAPELRRPATSGARRAALPRPFACNGARAPAPIYAHGHHNATSEASFVTPTADRLAIFSRLREFRSTLLDPHHRAAGSP